MSDPSAPAEPPETPQPSGSWAGFAAWAADELGVHLACDGGAYQLEEAGPDGASEPALTESAIRRGWFRRRGAKRTEAQAQVQAPEVCVADTPAELLAELARRLNERPAPASARPIEQPTAVHDFANELFEAYTLDDGGRAHLAGCHLTDVPLVRLTRIDDRGDSPTVSHRFFDELGVPVSDEQATALGVDRVACAADPLPPLDSGRLERMLDSARRAADAEPALVTLVWVKRVEGRIRFDFGDESLDTPFAGWARTLVAPPVVCPQTGAETFHLATTDDGTIAAAEEIGRCQVSGARHLRRDLVTCAVTKRLVDPALTAVCPVLGESVLKDHFATCPRCGERVAQTVLTRGGCLGCEVVQTLAADSPEAAEWRSVAPELAKTRRWRVGETATRRIGRSRGLLAEWLVVLDKETGDPVRVRTRKLFGPWSDLPIETRRRSDS